MHRHIFYRVTSKGLSWDMGQLQPRETAALETEEEGGGAQKTQGSVSFVNLKFSRLIQRRDKTTMNPQGFSQLWPAVPRSRIQFFMETSRPKSSSNPAASPALTPDKPQCPGHGPEGSQKAESAGRDVAVRCYVPLAPRNQT